MERPKSGTYIDDMPELFYHNREHGYSSSDLKSILKSTPFHFRHAYHQAPGAPSDSMKLGSAVHCKVLRPEAYNDEIVVMPDFNLRTKDGRMNRDIFVESHSDRLVISGDMDTEASLMANAVMENEEAYELLNGSVAERSLYADAFDIPVRARVDAYKPNCLLELKTARDGSPQGFSKAIANLYYHVSLAHYGYCLEQCVDDFKMSEASYYFIVVENTAPYAVSVYKASDSMVEVGFERWKEAMNKLTESLESDYWPAYSEGIEIDLPSWAYPKNESIEDLNESGDF